jgi:hypothetical protein
MAATSHPETPHETFRVSSKITRRVTDELHARLCPWASCRRCPERRRQEWEQQLKTMLQRWLQFLLLLLMPNLRECQQQQQMQRTQGRCLRRMKHSRTAR